ncbi:dna-binding protein [Citrus sinensis]|uniref:Dna-binding protein n=1 Tax=Citrus sinensis TaxID=2711 RepID=A0ACB8JMU9_CITSI|nr:dna-binding protein [Citrus sinensis]
MKIQSNPPHPFKRQACSQCSSFTHSHCTTPPPSPYLCHLCSPSSSSKTLMNDMSSLSLKRIDDKSAAMVPCATKIASSSMAKAVTVARNEAEKKVRDTALARKKAREAVERVAILITKYSNNIITTTGLFANEVKPEWNGIN